MHVDNKDKKLLWVTFTVGKKAALAACSCVGGPFIDMEVIFVTFVSPSTFLSHVFSYKTHLYLQSPHPNHKKHTPGVIQPSPHTHPNHKNNKMRDVIHSSPNSSISTPPSPPESLRWLSCFCYLANLACVLFRSCVLSDSEPT